MTSRITRVVCGDFSVTYDPDVSSMLSFTVRGLGGRIVRLRAPFWEAHRALVRECGLSKAEASQLLFHAARVES
ncbi:hypothetical protein GCM10009799_00210 [Nocardiopsis rhodophaea]|uniref:Ribbon-helix-helix domain-containing protein n=1 Tax=Nocardiopsis rhodophaea TaxID=280238 RepID=A0ABN2S200_9ACTN